MGFGAPGSRDLGAALLPDEAGEPAREFSLVGLGKGLIQHFGNGKTQDAITEELEPLVGFALASRRRADMGEGRRDQLAIGENDARCAPRAPSDAALSAPSYFTVLSILSHRTVQGHSQKAQAGSPLPTEKKINSARPTRFSNGT